MMKKQFVPYEIALKLKELDFNEPCFCYFNTYKVLKNCVIGTNAETNDKIELDKYNSRLLAPLWQQVIDWFREKYKIEAAVNYNYYAERGKITYQTLLIYDDYMSYESMGCYNSFEEAREEVILKAIELLEDKTIA